MLQGLALVSALMVKVVPWLHTHPPSTVGEAREGAAQGPTSVLDPAVMGFLNKGSTCSLLEASDPGVCAQLWKPSRAVLHGRMAPPPLALTLGARGQGACAAEVLGSPCSELLPRPPSYSLLGSPLF